MAYIYPPVGSIINFNDYRGHFATAHISGGGKKFGVGQGAPPASTLFVVVDDSEMEKSDRHYWITLSPLSGGPDIQVPRHTLVRESKVARRRKRGRLEYWEIIVCDEFPPMTNPPKYSETSLCSLTGK